MLERLWTPVRRLPPPSSRSGSWVGRPLDLARRLWIERRYARDPEAAVQAYLLYNGDSPESRSCFDPALIRRAVEFDYLHWPREIAAEVRGKRVLDVGCGTGLHAVGFLVVGAASYTGIDTKLRLDDDRSKNLRTRGKEPFGCTPRAMMQRLPRVELVPGSFEDVAPDRRFDVAILHNATEHLIRLEDVFVGIRERLVPGGRLIYHHHNYYCWNGHHLAPKYVADIVPGDPKQAKCVDWAHLAPDAERDAYLATRLNKIRLDDLRALTEKHFEIETWTERLTEAARGARRLTPQIRRRYPQYSERELRTQGVHCKARRRD